MIYLLIIVLLLAIYQAFDYSIRSEDSIKVIVLFVLFAFVYYLGIIFEMQIKGTSIGAFGIIINERVRLIILSMGILSIAGFSSGYLVSGFKFKDSLKSDLLFSDILVVTVVVLTSISGILLFVVFTDSILNSSSSYSGNFTETYSNPVYAFLKEIFTYGLAILISVLANGSRNRKLIALVPTIILIVFGMITSDKDPILLSVLGWGVAFFYRLTQLRLQTKRTYFITLILMSLIIPALSLLFSMYRTDAIKEFSKQLGINGLYTYFDASGPYESLVSVIEDPNIHFEYGKTYYWGFIGWIPKSVWQGRPLDLSESYAKEKIRNWQPGQGLGYSLLAEAYKNFGVAGALIQYFMIGLLFGFFGKLFMWLFKNKSEVGYLFYIWLAYNLAIMHRGPFNLPSSFIRFLLPFLLSYWSLDILFQFYARWRSKRV